MTCTCGGHPEQLAAGDSGVQLVPVHHLRLAESPAEVNLSAIHEAIKIAETAVRPFELDAKLIQLVDKGFELGCLGVKLGLALSKLFGVGIVRGSAMLA